MTICELVDFSNRSQSLIKLCEYPTVTLTDLAEIKDIISYIQLPLYQVQEGDNLSIHIVDNRIDGIKGFMAIWHNKGIACINTGMITEWGKWDDENKLILW